MKEFLAILFMILVGLVPELVKAKKKKTKDLKSPQTPPPYEPDEPVWESDIDMQKTEENLSKGPEYFTLETIEPEVENAGKYVRVKPEKTVQIVDNEEEKNIDLTFDKEELAKGIIYSEILKRKYN